MFMNAFQDGGDGSCYNFHVPPPKTTMTLFPLTQEQPIRAMSITTVAAPPPSPIPAGFLSLATAAAPTTNQQQQKIYSMSSFTSRVSEFMGERVGTEFTLVIQKKLNQTDLSIHNCRFSIRLTEMANEFLTAGEKHQLYEAGNIKIGCFVDPYMEISDKVSLRKWKQGNGCIYTIIGEAWKNVLKKKDLVAGDVVALWSFRTWSGKLCFALLTLERRPTAAEMMIEESPLQIMSRDIDLTLKL